MSVKTTIKRRGGLFVQAIRNRWQSLPDNRRKAVQLSAAVVFIAAAVIVIVVSYASLFTHGSSHASKKGGSGSSKSGTKTHSPKPATKPAPSGSGTTGQKSTPAPTSQVSTPAYPAGVLSLTDWKLTLPISGSQSNSPEEITQPQLATFALAPYFQLNGARNGVQFEAPVGGVTTDNSNFPRSELREMTDSGAQEASWSSNSGTNTMIVRQAITHLPSVHPQLVAGQIHGPSDYVILIRLEGSSLFVEAGGKNIGTLDGNYRLGTVFTLQVVASNGHVVVSYNGAQKVDYANSGSGYYFKAGCYTQSNPSKGDSPNDYGQVVIYGLQVSHT